MGIVPCQESGVEERKGEVEGGSMLSQRLDTEQWSKRSITFKFPVVPKQKKS
jgi:hypothetical protein